MEIRTTSYDIDFDFDFWSQYQQQVRMALTTLVDRKVVSWLELYCIVLYYLSHGSPHCSC